MRPTDLPNTSLRAGSGGCPHRSRKAPVSTESPSRSWGCPNPPSWRTPAARPLRCSTGSTPGAMVTALVGTGNNGGDALVLLRNLAAWGRPVTAILVGDRKEEEALLHGWGIRTLRDLDFRRVRGPSRRGAGRGRGDRRRGAGDGDHGPPQGTSGLRHQGDEPGRGSRRGPGYPLRRGRRLRCDSRGRRSGRG